MATEPRCRTLILLIGGNPLPNYLAAATLRPERAVLLHSTATERVAARLKAVLEDRCSVPSTLWPPIKDAASARDVRDALEEVVDRFGQEDLHLHYTGGNKVMAVHARLASARYLSDAQASYLDEQRMRLRFDDGQHKDLEANLLNLDTLFELHGLQASLTRLPDIEEARVRAVLGQPTYEALQKEEQQQRLKEGKWLEWLVAKLLRDLGVPEVRAVKKEGQRGPKFQVDVVGLRANRLYVISCTTSLGKERWDKCRSRLFEVALRARQLGGDLARPALVCLLDGQLSPDTDPADLESNVRASWEQAPNQLRVFGLPDVRAWAGVDGPSDRSSLEAWLRP